MCVWSLKLKMFAIAGVGSVSIERSVKTGGSHVEQEFSRGRGHKVLEGGATVCARNSEASATNVRGGGKIHQQRWYERC